MIRHGSFCGPIAEPCVAISRRTTIILCAMQVDSSTQEAAHSAVQGYCVASSSIDSNCHAAPKNNTLSATLQRWTQYLTVDKVSESYYLATLFACAAPCLNVEHLQCVCHDTGTMSGGSPAVQWRFEPCVATMKGAATDMLSSAASAFCLSSGVHTVLPSGKTLAMNHVIRCVVALTAHNASAPSYELASHFNSSGRPSRCCGHAAQS